MARNQNNLKRSDGTANAFARAALSSTALASCSPASYTTIDPESVAEEIFGASIDLEDRDAVLDLLESVLPLDPDGTVSDSIVQRALFTSTQRSSTTSSGPFAPFHLTAQTLAANGALLREIRPLSDFSGTNRCDYKTLMPLIQNTVSQLVSQAGAPDGPNEGVVNDLLLNLTGYKPGAGASFDVNTIGGLLGELRNRCGVQIDNRCSRRDEGIVAAFSSHVALAGAVVRAWDDVQTTGGSEYLVVAESTVRRCFGGIQSNLQQLRELIDDDAWLTTVLPTTPPMVAAKLYQWIWQYVSTQAPQILTAGEDGFASIALTIKSMAEHVSTGFQSPATDPLIRLRAPSAAPRKDCPAPGLDVDDFVLPENPCEAIPFAFSGDEVKGVVKSVLCHFQQVLDVAGSMVGATTVVKHGDIVDGANQKIEWATQDERVWVRACGNALESVPVYARGEDGTTCDAQYHSAFEGGVKFTLDLTNASVGRNKVFAGKKLLANVLVLPAARRTPFEPGQSIETPDASSDTPSPARKSSTTPKSKA